MVRQSATLDAARFIPCFVLLAGALTCQQLFAQTGHSPRRLDAKQPSTLKTNSRDWFITAYLGAALPLATDLTLTQPRLQTHLLFQNVSLQGKSFAKPLYYGLRGGFFLKKHRWLGFDVEFIHQKVTAMPEQQTRISGRWLGLPVSTRRELREFVERYSISHGVNLLLLNAVGRYSIGSRDQHSPAPLVLLFRAGAGPTIPHTESSIGGLSQEQYEFGRLAWQGGAGAEVRLHSNWHLLGEYKFTRTRQRGSVFSGEIEALVQAQHIVFGLSYYF